MVMNEGCIFLSLMLQYKIFISSVFKSMIKMSFYRWDPLLCHRDLSKVYWIKHCQG